MRTWKVLLAVALVLPPAAYVAGAVAAPGQDPQPRAPIVLRPTADATPTPRPGDPAPSTGPTSGPTRGATPDGNRGRGHCEDDDDDDVVFPCPEDDDHDDRDDQDDRDDDEDRGRGGGGSDDDGDDRGRHDRDG